MSCVVQEELGKKETEVLKNSLLLTDSLFHSVLFLRLHCGDCEDLLPDQVLIARLLSLKQKSRPHLTPSQEDHESEG